MNSYPYSPGYDLPRDVEPYDDMYLRSDEWMVTDRFARRYAVAKKYSVSAFRHRQDMRIMEGVIVRPWVVRCFEIFHPVFSKYYEQELYEFMGDIFRDGLDDKRRFELATNVVVAAQAERGANLPTETQYGGLFR